MTRAAVIALAGICLLLVGCSQPRARATLHVGGGKVRVVPSLYTSIAGIGVTVKQ